MSSARAGQYGLQADSAWHHSPSSRLRVKLAALLGEFAGLIFQAFLCCVFADVFGDVHRSEVRGLGAFLRQGFVVELARGHRVEAEVEVPAGHNVSCQRAQRVERRFVTSLELFRHDLFNYVDGQRVALSTIPSQILRRACNAHTAAVRASSCRTKSPPHNNSTISRPIPPCSSPSNSMCRCK